MALDREAQLILDLIIAANRPPYETLTAPEARKLYRDGRHVLAPEPPEVSETRDMAAPGPHGPIPLRFYRPAGAAAGAALPLLVFYHGGGWVIGDLDTHDVVCRHLANAGFCAVLSVDYRVAPEHKFPAAVDDCIAATRWAADQAASLGIDPARIAVGGDSAGGNLAAVVCLHARDSGGPKIAFQLLLYPATAFGMEWESQRRFADGHLLTEKNQAWFRGHYLRGQEDQLDWRASPLRAASLKGLPPAWVLTAGYDPLRDEGEAYATRLQDEGVPTAHIRFLGQIHGFLTMGKLVPAANAALDQAGAALKRALR